MNNSLPTEAYGLSPLLVALRTSFIAFIGPLIISGNLLSIIVTRRVSNLADSTKVLMTTLAVADLLVGVMTLFSFVASILDSWPFGDLGCRMFSIGAFLSFGMSIISIIYLNFERYIAVTRPYQFPVWCSRRRVITLVLVTITVCLCTITVLQFRLSVQYYEGSATCFFANSSAIVTTLILVLGDIVPTIIMTSIYYYIIKISRQHERRVNANGQNEANINNLQDNKALKTFLVVTLTFATCFTPSLLSRTVEAHTGELLPGWIQFLSVWFMFCNSAFNVFIYCLFNRSYRQTAKRIIAEILPCCARSVVPVNI